MSDLLIGRSRQLFSGDQREFTAWVEPHWPAMVSLARRLVPLVDAEDVAQDALVNAWRKRARFDPDRGTPRPWLLALTADQARQSHRRRARVPTPTQSTDHVSVVDTYVDTDLYKALAALSTRQRLAVELVYYLQLPLREAAQVMNCREGTVKSTLAAARAHLRTHLEEDPR